MPDEHDRMAHHVVQHAAALQVTTPEPRFVRTAMFFCRPGKIRTPREGNPSIPDDLSPDLYGRREELILEIPVAETGSFDQFQNPLRLSDIPGERFFARQAVESSTAALDRTYELFYIFHRRVRRSP